MDFSKLTLAEVVNKIKNKEFTAVDLTKYHLDLANTRGKQLNAFITVTEKYALERAQEIDDKIKKGKEVGKLAGVPFTAKDLYMTKGIETTASSRTLEGFIAPYTATVVKKLEDEGAILIGKTNSDPFGFGGSGENSGYGPAKNPLDESRSPGGSTSGGAASLKAGIGLFAIGTDTGGSIRAPASYCGLVGLKVTYGRNSRYGVIAMASSFDTPGILVNDVESAALVESIMAGKDPLDATTYDVPVDDYVASVKEKFSFKGLRVGLPDEFLKLGISEETKEQVLKAVENIKKAGAEIIPLSIPLIKYAVAIYYVLVPSEISSNQARYDGLRYGRKVADDYATNLIESRGKYMEDEIKRRVMIGTYALSAGYADQYYKTALKVRAKLTKQMRDILQNKVDIIIGPTSPNVALKLGEKVNDPLSLYLEDVYVGPPSVCGIPAISIPCGVGKDSNMPVGLQIMADRFAEAKLLKIAHNIMKLNDE